MNVYAGLIIQAAALEEFICQGILGLLIDVAHLSIGSPVHRSIGLIGLIKY